MSARTILVVVLALVCGGSAAVGVNLYSRYGVSQPDMVPVVVATKSIPRGKTLAADELKVINWPKGHVPPGSLSVAEEAIGRVVFSQLAQDEPILESKVSAKNAKGGLASLVPAGMRAFTILTPNIASGVAGFILPGNKVDVLLTLNGDERTGGGVTTTLLQNVEILAVDTHLDSSNDNKMDPRHLQSVTLLVTPDQAAKLNLGQDRGTLHLSLRNPDDELAARTRPATLSGLQFHQEKPWTENFKEMLEAYAKAKGHHHAEAAPKEAPADAPLPPPLEIRTLRGRYSGVVQVAPLDQTATNR